ncbi:MAG: DUF721 domain-containing protein [Actinomycetota bacterium]
MTRAGGDPRPLREALDALVRRFRIVPPEVLDTAAAAWLEVAGDELAAHSRVRSVRDGECVVEADGPAWATRARYLGGVLRDLLDDRLGAGSVGVVKVVVRPPEGTFRDPPVR